MDKELCWSSWAAQCAECPFPDFLTLSNFSRMRRTGSFTLGIAVHLCAMPRGQLWRLEHPEAFATLCSVRLIGKHSRGRQSARGATLLLSCPVGQRTVAVRRSRIQET